MQNAKLEYRGESGSAELAYIQTTLLHRSSCIFVPKNILTEKNDNATPRVVESGKKHRNITRDEIHK